MTKLYLTVSLLLAMFSSAMAQAPQDPPATPPAAPAEEQAGDIIPEAESGESAVASVVDGILGNTVTHLGFAFSTYQMFTTNAFRDENAEGIVMTTFYPQIFSNFRGRRSQFHFDYGLGYRAYQHRNELNTVSHSASLSWQFRLGRYTYFNVADTFHSSPNDYGFTPSNLSQVQIQPIYSRDVLVDRQRLTRNSLSTSLGQRVGRKTNVTLFSSYDYLRYGGGNFGDTQGFQVGLRSDHQITSWLYLDNSYSTYLNAMDDKLRSSNTHRFQVGGFRFKLSPATQIFVSGAIEYARFVGVAKTVAAFDVGLTKRSQSNNLYITYHRGLSTTLGPGTLLDGHDALASFTRRLSQRLSLQLDATYTRGAGFEQDSSMESFSGNSGIQFALFRNLILSTSVGYVSQHLRNLPFGVPDLNRYTAYAGLQYFMPTLRGR